MMLYINVFDNLYILINSLLSGDKLKRLYTKKSNILICKGIINVSKQLILKNIGSV